MLMQGDSRTWDVRLDRPDVRKICQQDGTIREVELKKHHFATVVASTLIEAAAMVMAEWPDATIWQINCHGKDNHILINDAK